MKTAKTAGSVGWRATEETRRGCVTSRTGWPLVVIALWFTVRCGGPEVPVVNAPLLAKKPGGQLLFRTEFATGGRLLIKNAESKYVYAYDPGSQSLSLIPSETWGRASGDIGAECGVMRGAASGPRLHVVSGQLFADDRRVATAGKIVISLAASPEQDVVAVLSANDRFRLPSIMPFLGGGGPPSGQHYHQLFSVPDLKPIGGPKRLAIKAESGMMTCWSPGGVFVIYAYVSGNRMCIVPVEESGG